MSPAVRSYLRFKIECCLEDRLPVNKGAEFLHNRLLDDRQRRILPVHRDRLVEHSLQAVRPLEDSQRAGKPTLCQGGDVNGAHARNTWREALPLRDGLGMYAGEGNVIDGGD